LRALEVRGHGAVVAGFGKFANAAITRQEFAKRVGARESGSEAVVVDVLSLFGVVDRAVFGM
jgi:hypothetical protein